MEEVTASVKVLEEWVELVWPVYALYILDFLG